MKSPSSLAFNPPFSRSVRDDVVRVERRIDGIEATLQAMELRLTVKLGIFLGIAVGLIAALIKLG